jgi:DNA-binding MarR family transcriptional regulator
MCPVHTIAGGFGTPKPFPEIHVLLIKLINQNPGVGVEIEMNQVDKPAELAFRALLRTSGLIGRVMHPYFARFGISGSQWGALRTLYRAETEGSPRLRLTDLSDRLLVRPPSITGVIDRLERLGYVVRTNSAVDLRSKEVRLTDAGRELVARILTGHKTQIAAVMDGLVADDQLHLRSLLDRLGCHLEGMLTSSPGRDEL